MQSIQIDASCWARRGCVFDCVCDEKLPALRLLSRLFFETRIAAAKDDDSNAAYLSNSIATANRTVRSRRTETLAILQDALDVELPSSDLGGVIRGDGFQTLLEAVEEFAVVHEAALTAERVRAEQPENGNEDAEGEDKDAEMAGAEAEADTSNHPVAMEAGQLIKDLAIALRQMA